MTAATSGGARVWDAFLTEADRASLVPRPELKWGVGERPALIMVDLYRSVFGDEPQPLPEAMKLWPSSCGLHGWNALPHAQRLLSAARAAGLPIVHLTALDPDSGVQSWGSRAQNRWAAALDDPEAKARYERRFDIVGEVAPLPGEAVLRKTAPSAFWGTPLLGHLNAQRVDTLIVGGESTSGCVRATVVDGRSYRFNMIVAEEATFDRHEAPHAVNLFDMHQKYADVLPVDRVLELIGAGQGAA